MKSIRPIRRLLIANRGEIAVRIARTAHRLGIATVGVYAEPDRNALHVDAVERAFALDGAAPAESYLNIDKLIAAAVWTDCDAVHPGYGFLAESAAFARAVDAAGLIWVGPGAEQIALLGDKLAAKEMAEAAGVATAPAFRIAPDGDLPQVELPVMVKAAAGGGGRGMRVVTTPAELAPAVVAAAREATAAFGDGTVFLEPLIADARHIEVQVLGDGYGNIIHLGERECSIQRRHQKIIEEAPSAGIDAATREILCNGAVALTRHIGYENAGTVEFLVEADGAVSFLEVNTRLQVEHPVTEMITGIDLVEQQLRIAAGEPLALRQQDVHWSGHAIEARLVAEDPSAGWLPAVGSIHSFEIGGEVRVDPAVHAGSQVSADYDSLLAKVIAHGATRSAAIAKLTNALRTTRISGLATNRATLAAVLGEADFRAAATPLSYLADHPEVEQAAGLQGDDLLALLLGAALAREQRDRAVDPVTGFAPSGWRNLRTGGQRQSWMYGDEVHHVEYVIDGDIAHVRVGDPPFPGADGTMPEDDRRLVSVRLLDRSNHRQVLEIDGIRTVVNVRLDGDLAETGSPAGTAGWRFVPRFIAHEAEEAGSGPVAPLPGTVTEIAVAPGTRVAAGDLLVVVEAMKMEHRITAGSAAEIIAVRCAVGDRVDAGDLLVELRHL